MIWLGWVLWHINHCWLFNAKFFLYIYSKYIGFDLVGFYGISNIGSYLMQNYIYIYIYIYIYSKYTWFCLFLCFLWHINHCRLFNAKSFLYICSKYIWFALVGFYGISTTVGYLMSNLFYTYILDIYDLVWCGLWHINQCRLFNAKSVLYIYIRYIRFGLIWFMAYQPLKYILYQIIFIHIYWIYYF